MVLSAHVTIRKRVTCLFLLIVVFMIALGLRLMYLQFFKSSWLTENALEQRIRDIPVESKRGTIFDRNGRELGVSINTESVYAIPAEIVDVDETAAKLAAILTLDKDKNRVNRLPLIVSLYCDSIRFFLFITPMMIIS